MRLIRFTRHTSADSESQPGRQLSNDWKFMMRLWLYLNGRQDGDSVF